MHILVTGANGLLGQKLANLFTYQVNDHVLFLTGKGIPRFDLKGHRYLSKDLRKRAEVAELINEVRPEIIIHCAALTQVDLCEKERTACYETNFLATKYLVEAIENLHCHFTYLSTDFVFDGITGPYKETDRPNPVNYYGEIKYMSEQYLASNHIRSTIVRTVLVYGYNGYMSRMNIVLWVKGNLEKGKKIRMVNDQFRTPTLAEDLAEACIELSLKGQEGIFHVSGKEMMTPYALSLRVARYFDLDESLISPIDGTEFIEIAKRPPKTGFSIDKVKKSIDYNPRSLEEGLAIIASQL